MKTLKNLFLNPSFYWYLAGITGLFIMAYWIKVLFFPAIAVLVGFIVLTIFNIAQLFSFKFKLEAVRKIDRIISLGEDCEAILELKYTGKIPIACRIIDELPYQFRLRNFELTAKLQPNENVLFTYKLRPTVRGEYEFGHIIILVASRLGLVSRRIVAEAGQKIAVYPSTVLMKKFSLYAAQKISTDIGLRKMRRIGHSYEFDHIKSYTPGDDPRSINWKASGRRANLMVNHYVDEKAQQIYCLLDKSRAMQMPFDGLTLLDHAINTTLMICNAAMQKSDKAGLLSFSNKLGNVIKAGTGKAHLNRIYKALYKEKEHHLEANYEMMYNATRRLLGGRSLLFLFTNFESTYALDRVLPILRQLNRIHLLVVVFFRNSHIYELSRQTGNTTKDVYNKAIAGKFLMEKEIIQIEMRKHKIQVVYTTPEELPLDTLNKYLELKARGMI